MCDICHVDSQRDKWLEYTPSTVFKAIFLPFTRERAFISDYLLTSNDDLHQSRGLSLLLNND